MHYLFIYITVSVCILNASLFAMEKDDVVVDIDTIRANVFREAVSDDLVEAELNELEQGINWEKEDKKIVKYLSKDLSIEPSETVEKALLSEIKSVRSQNAERYQHWQLLLKLENAKKITRTKSKMSEKREQKTLVDLLKAQQQLHSLYFMAYQKDMDIRLKELEATQSRTELTKKRFKLQKGTSIISGFASLFAIGLGIYNFLSSGGYI